MCPRMPLAHRAHLERLMRTWAPLADISFADLLLCVPHKGGDTSGYVVVGHMRPSTSRALHRTEMVGAEFPRGSRPLIDLARVSGQVIDGGRIGDPLAPRIRTLSVPVRYKDKVIAVLSREFSPDEQREPGELEMNYFFTFRRLAQMISEGTYPFPGDDLDIEVLPRVSDGLLLVDASARVRFASPNAVSVLSRLGVRRVEGERLSSTGLPTKAVRLSFADRQPHLEELSRGDSHVVLWCMPLLETGELTGAVVLLRDITELRRRDRLLMSKDARIAEIHHRVKNNLQTISSLLRLQGRRVVNEEARTAIEESVRRIRSIAVVHEILSQEVANDVPFTDIARPLVRVVEEGFSSTEQPLRFTIAGDVGTLPTDVATPLAVVLTELMQNAVEHGFGGQRQNEATVAIEFENVAGELHVSVVDDGVGVPEDFDIDQASGLGLTIVRSLIEADLGGSITVEALPAPRSGTAVRLVVPQPGPTSSG